MPETERLRSSAEFHVINGTSLEIDVYVNGESEPTISDPASFAVGQTFVVDGAHARPFQVYSFAVRAKDDPGGEVLAAASVFMERGRSFTGVFHWRPDASFQLSIYENDLSRGTAGRLTVRNTSALARVDWRIVPKGGAAAAAADERAGTLGHGEWQICRQVATGGYLFEAFADGGKVTQDEDLDIGPEQNVIVHIVGAPYPTSDDSLWERWMVQQELEYDRGQAGAPVTTAPAPPHAAADVNAPVEFDCRPVTLPAARGGSVPVSAVDPDGWVRSLRIAEVSPKVDGFAIADGALSPSRELGGPASATVLVDPALPAGQYAVTIEANAGTRAEAGRGALTVTIGGADVGRLKTLIESYSGNPSIEPGYADQLTDRLEAAAAAAGAGDTGKACRIVEELLAGLDDAGGARITAAAQQTLAREAAAVRQRLGRG